MKNILLGLILLIALIRCNDNVEKKPGSPKLVRDIDKIKLTDMNGKDFSLKQYAGKTIFINFWATWCKPCVQEMPSIAGAQDSLKDRGVIFLLASGESPDHIKEFSNNHDYTFNYVRIENSEEVNVETLPTTFIFNGAGDKSFSETGVRKWNEKINIDIILKIANQK